MHTQVTVVGAAGGIGQPMSLLLKLSGKVEHLSLFDIVNTPGVAADISHCNSKGKVCTGIGITITKIQQYNSLIRYPIESPRATATAAAEGSHQVCASLLKRETGEKPVCC